MDRDELICPFCGAVQYDVESAESDYRAVQICEHCGKKFWYAVKITREYAVYEEE